MDAGTLMSYLETIRVAEFASGTTSSWASAGGVRPRNPDSRHAAIYLAHVVAGRCSAMRHSPSLEMRLPDGLRDGGASGTPPSSAPV
ncbi:hypothetical protein OG423_02720 [Micromonospora zamorensis]|uniref:hypothetical protein n=1 Tax=Micromonospora zamorensis TaxID=709883 RepID=UPI00081F8A38|nr:hypothetical protein [Micromonospora zamorensis]WSK49358.1 hypothetical protein OG423_02720 [Micromonospora zamorensis]SCG54836.1 hypothetical protein GA0070619_3174 [Micromonospora zamorensis]